MRKRRQTTIIVPKFIKATVKYPEQDVIAEFSGDALDLGVVVKARARQRLGIPVENLLEHALVVGSTGSGKTHTVAKILRELSTKVDHVISVVLDWHGEYSKLLEEFTYISPHEAPVTLTPEDHESFLDLLSDTLELSPPQAFVLKQVIERSGGRIDSVETLIDALEEFEDQSGWMRESRLALLRKLAPLKNSKYSRLVQFDSSIQRFNFLIENARSSTIVVGLAEIHNTLVRRIYSAMVIRSISENALSNSLERRVLLVIEEAQNYIDREKPLRMISTMLAEIRKFGVGVILVSQSPSKLLEDAMINTNTKIVHSIKSSVDLDVVNKVLYLPFEYQRIIPYLDVGEAVVYTRGLKKPVIVKIEW